MPYIFASQHVVEALVGLSASQAARVSQAVVEVLVARPTPSPTTITGAGVSQDVVEVLIALSGAASVRVSQAVIEVLMVQGDPPATPVGGAVTRGWVMAG